MHIGAIASCALCATIIASDSKVEIHVCPNREVHRHLPALTTPRTFSMDENGLMCDGAMLKFDSIAKVAKDTADDPANNYILIRIDIRDSSKANKAIAEVTTRVKNSVPLGKKVVVIFSMPNTR